MSTTESGGRMSVRTDRQLKQCLTTQTYGTNNIPMECNMRQPKQNRVWKLKILNKFYLNLFGRCYSAPK